jgi:hypothetical protein
MRFYNTNLIGIKLGGDGRVAYIYIPVAPAGVEVEDEELLVGGEVAALHVRPQVVEPPQAAALPRPLQPCTYICIINCCCNCLIVEIYRYRHKKNLIYRILHIAYVMHANA